MNRIHITSLRVRLMLLVAITLSPSVAMISFNATERKDAAERQVRLEAERLIERTSNECETLLVNADNLLTVVSRTPEVRRMDTAASVNLFRELLPGNPQYFNFGLADMKGRVVASLLPLPGTVNIADRGYYRRAISTRDFTVGEYQIGRIVPRAAVNVAVPVIDRKGKIQGVLFAALDLGFLGRLSMRLQLPVGADFTIIDRNGVIAVRYPDTSKWLGKPVRELPEGQTILSHDSGVTSVRGANGEERHCVFASLKAEQGGINAKVSVSVPMDVVLHEVNYTRLRNLIFILGVVVLTMLAAAFGADVFVLRPLRRMLSAIRRVTAGDLNVRTGLGSGSDELALLGRSFDEMTQSLQVARDDLLRSEHERQQVYTEVIRCVTNDRFHLVERSEIPTDGTVEREMPLANAEDYSNLRVAIREVANEVGMTAANSASLVQATGEAATNALKHAHGARCAIIKVDGALRTRISDGGPGIMAQDLTATILKPGFSTKVSLGMGYTLMLELSDRVWLATGPDGTTVQLQKSLVGREDIDPGLEAAMMRLA